MAGRANIGNGTGDTRQVQLHATPPCAVGCGVAEWLAAAAVPALSGPKGGAVAGACLALSVALEVPRGAKGLVLVVPWLEAWPGASSLVEAAEGAVVVAAVHAASLC